MSPIQNNAENPEKMTEIKHWHVGTHERALSYHMNTNMTGFRWFSKIFVSLCFGEFKVASALEGL